MRDYLITEIEKRRAEMIKIDAERDALAQRRGTLEIELRAYADILARFGQEGELERREPITTKAPIAGPVRTKLAGHWRAVLEEAVRRHPKVISLSEVSDIQTKSGYVPAPRTNVRTHFHKLVSEGLYERGERGEVRATEKAATVLGIPLGSGGNAAAIETGTETPNSGELFGAPKTNGSAPSHP